MKKISQKQTFKILHCGDKRSWSSALDCDCVGVDVLMWTTYKGKMQRSKFFLFVFVFFQCENVSVPKL